MSNIYVSPVAAPSFERLSTEAQTPANEFTTTNDEGMQLQKLDENANEVLVDSTKTETDCKPSGALDSKEKFGELRQTKGTKSPNLPGKIITGDEFETPSGTITTLRLSTGSQEKSPLYCFHSFTYGVGGSNENEAGNGISVQNCNVFEDQSYDADSSNVLHTRMVVDSEETGSPTFLCADWNWGAEEGDFSNDSVSSKETGNVDSAKVTYTGFQNPEDASSTSGEGESTDGKTPQNSEQDENENSREESCENNETNVNIRRLSPEGAEYLAIDRADIRPAIDDGDIASYLMVPDKRLVAEAQRQDTLGSSLGRSPSGRMDDKDFWTLDDTLEGKEVVDGDCQDRVPLLHPGKPRVWYTAEEGFEEIEGGVSVPCFPCHHCVIL